jgi:ribonuclease BN (tRNA processing enzyme)
MKSFSVTCLGVGDGWSCADRNHASFLYRLGGTSIVVDCGEPVDGGIKAGDLKHKDIDAIFLSHLHSDHVGGIFMLMQGSWLERRTRGLPIHLPGGAIQPLKGMLNTALLFPELLGFSLTFAPLKEGSAVSTGGVRVTPFATTHLNTLRARFAKKYPVDFSAFCFLIESGRYRIGHSADIGAPEDLEPLLSRPLDLLVCEMSHSQPENLFGYLKDRRIKKVVFVHLSRWQWDNLAKVRRLAARMLPGIPHGFARDGQIFEIGKSQSR